MNAIVVSDLHIGSKYFLYQNFESFLHKIPDATEIILNGDIIDNPYAKLSKADQGMLDRIAQISHRQKVVWVRGNHDNGYIPQNLGKIQIKQSHVIKKRLFVTHGDFFDEIMPRNRLFIKTFRILHDLRVKLGARPVHVAQYAKKWRVFYNVLRKSVMINAVNYAKENGFEAVACGHTHYAEEIIYNSIKYINTGAWTELPGYYLQVSSNEMALRRSDEIISNLKAPKGDKFGSNSALSASQTRSNYPSDIQGFSKIDPA
jgi:UDP-2,3-diacylglucosamine pyrophosphatase LpxH